MIFNDITERFNEINLVLDELKEFYNCAIALNAQSDSILKNSIFYTYYSYSTGNYSTLVTAVKEAISKSDNILDKQRMSKLGRILAKLERKGLEDIESNIVKKLVSALSEFDDCIYELNNVSPDNFPSAYSNLINSASNFIHVFDMCREIITELNYFELLLMGNVDNLNSENTFSIRLYNEYLSIPEINSSIKTLSDIYERTCSIFDISVSEYPLEPLKIETGSLWEKVFGHEKAVGFMSELFSKIISYVHRNFTNEGKISTVGTKVDAIKEAIELSKICKEHGLDTSAADSTIEANLNVLCNDIYKLTTSSSKIAINGKVYDLSESIKNNVLSNNVRPLIAQTLDEDEDVHEENKNNIEN